MNVRAFEPVEDAINRLSRDDFLSAWPSVYMTVRAGEVAQFSHIDLEGIGRLAAELETVRFE